MEFCAKQKLRFPDIFRVHFDLNILFGGAGNDLPKAFGVGDRCDIGKAIRGDVSPIDTKIQDRPIEAVETAFFAGAEREGSAYPSPVRKDIFGQDIRAKVHVMVAIIEIGGPAIKTQEFLIL